MEQLTGVWLYEVLRAVETGDTDQLERWREQNMIPEDIATTLLYSIAVQCYRHRVFHADPHPGNIMVMPEGKIGFIDFGLIGWLDERQVLQEFKLNQHIFREEFHAAYRSLLALIEAPPLKNAAQFELEIKELLRGWTWDIRHPGAPVMSKSITTLLVKLLEIMRRFNVAIPMRTLRLYRTLIVSDMIILKIAPQLNRFELLQLFIKEELAYQQKQKFLAATEFDRLTGVLVKGLDSIEELVGWVGVMRDAAPLLVNQLNRSRGSFVLNVFAGLLTAVYSFFLFGLIAVVVNKVVLFALLSGTMWSGIAAELNTHFPSILAGLVVVLIGLGHLIARVRAQL
jgi:predicted unusual protein kinase regulating ubiquinone biosynthesis (AarF/ABC1/UbiB family)